MITTWKEGKQVCFSMFLIRGFEMSSYSDFSNKKYNFIKSLKVITDKERKKICRHIIVNIILKTEFTQKYKQNL